MHFPVLPELEMALVVYARSLDVILVVGLYVIHDNLITSFAYLLDTLLVFKIDSLSPPYPIYYQNYLGDRCVFYCSYCR